MKVKKIQAQEILDSRGDPTLKVWVTLESGAMGEASVPSGASTGVHEAVELRDGDKKRYSGKGVLKAVKNVSTVITKKITGMSVEKLREIDEEMIKLDGTSNKRRLGANAILGVSLACAHAGAYGSGTPLYKWLRRVYGLQTIGYRLPTPLMNLFNGGKHADTNLDIQEFLAIPYGFKTVSEKIRAGAEIFHALGHVLKSAGKDTDVGNEGGYAPRFKSNEEPFQFFVRAVEDAGYNKPGLLEFGIDAAASEFYDKKEKRYILKLEKKKFSVADLMKFYERLMARYPLVSIEDPFAEDDWEAWAKFNAECKKQNIKLRIIGDDLYTTNVDRLEKGIKLGASNAILIKPNQIGTLSETMDTIALAQKHDMKIIISHRSGETLDTTIADLAVAVNAEYIKAGAPSRGERIAKYNRLLEIEKEV
ncbi:MAG: Enolase [Parcubacteria group bacterium GW2011_GWC2_45_7]|nr:MAG: Enolase [Parcubacteria group bacterium GW2011_GWC2_45_7]KKU72909.1 MAG: Enolase [Parcubacteria group bacterium GW2011_GWA2_47_26]